MHLFPNRDVCRQRFQYNFVSCPKKIKPEDYKTTGLVFPQHDELEQLDLGAGFPQL